MSLGHGIDEVSGVPATPREARTAVGLLVGGRLSGPVGTADTDIALAVSELVAHAQRHTPGISRFAAFRHGGVLEVTVDYRDGAPADFHCAGAALLGWMIVTSVALSVTVTRPGGTAHRVRAVLQLD
ncbi:hypothetical protein ABT127_21915 [Streptomyces sp. NPDC001904]|uniref:hypothetical protein n=1 Tax=Streptomyces sp. NPDC001904 TaxID=3154531 RepID=UPI003316BF5A